MPERMSYFRKRRICKDYYKKCRKGWMDRVRKAIRRDGDETE